MIELINEIIWWFGLFALLLVQYIILFKLYYKMHPGPYPVWAKLFAAAFVIQDVFLNLTAFTVLMLDVPREWTITERMRRYKSECFGKQGIRNYRYVVADNLCKILNVFDKDGHC